MCLSRMAIDQVGGGVGAIVAFNDSYSFGSHGFGVVGGGAVGVVAGIAGEQLPRLVATAMARSRSSAVAWSSSSSAKRLNRP